MPSDFLRDVLRTEDAARRAPRRWPLFPLSLAVHAFGALAYFVIPLAAAVTPPPPAPLHPDRRVLIRVLPPEPVEIKPDVRLNTPADSEPVSFAPVPTTQSFGPETAVPRISSDSSWPSGTIGEPQGLPGVPHGTGAAGLSGEGRRGVSSERDTAGDTKPLKIGGNIRAPQRLSATPPVYPPIAQAAHVQGQVIVEALIDQTGRVGDVRVLRSVPLLDAAAVDAVRTWRYAPTLLNGVPVPVLLTVTVSFTLQR